MNLKLDATIPSRELFSRVGSLLVRFIGISIKDASNLGDKAATKIPVSSNATVGTSSTHQPRLFMLITVKVSTREIWVRCLSVTDWMSNQQLDNNI